MTTVTSATGASSASTSSAQSGSALSGDYQTFLRMLTVQMQNQDPLNPIESTDYAVQLATFSGVEQQVVTNQLLESLATQMGVMGMAQLAGWVGMEARSEAPAYFDGTPITVSPNPILGADQAVLVITDEAGKEVSRQMIEVSSDPITWDGRTDSGDLVPEGIYNFTLENYENGELLETTTVETYSRIVEAQGTSAGTVLVLAGGVTIGTADVTALRDPDAS
ncbi:flagellar hook capping FlgD N-terminal domain-containing protein [Pseudothioclava arenosa]|uniref:Basal-body rod modification protein FlgD n=1 Tax=Pseudothioclava arenosa TaxID=1795308 RepID=A0A2A4CKM5_9RHOB|nr:flagellar hook capping FlgD N-terminal domain-containing protein [Pseudothioclava arenosa]PCD76573.1 flagellar basal body rod modification protein [Pseudothioclava arenosa]